jgi:prevent-host-death family protein
MEAGNMPITTLSSRQFNQETGRAKKASKQGPVFITDRGQPSYVLLSFEDYRAITRRRRSIAESLAMPEAGDFDFEFPRVGDELVGPADLS